MLAARAIASERARESADERIVRLVRTHHLHLERLLADAIGDDLKAWKLQLAYRGDTILIACSADRFADLLVIAWAMVDETGRGSGLPTCVGLSVEDVIDVAEFRPGLPVEWPRAADLQGLAIERALGLVHDFASEGQVLLCGPLVDKFNGDDIGSRIPSAKISTATLEPVKKQALVLHADLETLPVGQMRWEGVSAGDLTNRHVLGRELKDIQPKLTKLVEFLASIGGTLKEAYSGQAGAYRVKELDEPLLQTAKERLDDVLSAWNETSEARCQEDLAGKVDRMETEYKAVAQRFRDLEAAVSTEDTGRQGDARVQLQDAWHDLRAVAPELLEDVASYVKDLYT